MIDPYVLENGTLKNKLGITDYEELRKAEAGIGAAKLIDIGSEFLRDFDAELLRNLHKHIFGDIYDWAGQYRTTPLYKAELLIIPGRSLNYTEPKKIVTQLDEKLKVLNATSWKGKSVDEISLEFAKKLADIWKVHPFRDGNTRAVMSFADLYARMHGFPFDMGIVLFNLDRQYDENGNPKTYSIRDMFVAAAVDEYPEPELLARVLKRGIERGALPEVTDHIKKSGDGKGDGGAR